MRNQLFQVIVFTCISLFAFAQNKGEIPITTSSEEARENFIKGRDHQWLGTTFYARKYFNRAIEIDSTFALAYLYRSLSSPTNDQWLLDINNAGKYISMASDGERMMLEIERSNLEIDRDKRLKLAVSLVDAYPQSAWSSIFLGSTYAVRNENEKARRCFEKAIELNKDCLAGYAYLGNSYMVNQPVDYKMAEYYLTQVVQMRPELPGCYLNLGGLLRVTNELDKAADAYSKSLQLDPNLPGNYIARGHIYTFKGEFEKAINDYRKVTQLNPDNVIDPLIYEAFTFLYAGDFQKAKKFLEEKASRVNQMGLKQALAVDARFSFLYNCAMIARFNNEPDDLQKYVREMWPVHLEMGKRLGTREAELQTTATMLIWDGLVLCQKKDFVASRNKFEEARQALEPIKNPGKLSFYYSGLAEIEFRQGNYKKAIEYWSQSTPTILVQYWTALSYEKSGETVPAMKIYSSIVNSNLNNIGYALIRKELKQRLNQ